MFSHKTQKKKYSWNWSSAIIGDDDESFFESFGISLGFKLNGNS